MTKNLIDLINDGTPWKEWPASSKAQLAVLFLPLFDRDLDRPRRGEARLLNVHLFKNFTAKPPKVVLDVLKNLPQVAQRSIYESSAHFRKRIMSECPPRSLSLPGVQ